MPPDSALATAAASTAASLMNPMSPSSTRVAAAVRLEGVTKVFGTGRDTVAALDALSLDIEKGSFTCVVGASGCGKTTLLNLIAGLDEPTSGEIEVTGRTALMFQESALFPWLTAAGNVELALRLRGVGRRPRQARAESSSSSSTSVVSPTSDHTSCPAACASASLSPVRSRRTPMCC